MTTEYESAIAAHDKAQAEYFPVSAAYLAGDVSDEIYLAARATYDEATKTFDEAFAKAQSA